jgi:hypothetical protein
MYISARSCSIEAAEVLHHGRHAPSTQPGSKAKGHHERARHSMWHVVEHGAAFGLVDLDDQPPAHESTVRRRCADVKVA